MACSRRLSVRPAASLVAALLVVGGCPAPEPAPPAEGPRLELVVDGGRFALRRGAVGLEEVEAVLLLEGGEERLLSSAPDLESAQEGAAHTLTGTVDGFSFTLVVEEREDHARARMRAEGGSARVAGFALRGRATADPGGVYQEGYASWGPAHYVRLGAGEPGERSLTGIDGDHFVADPRVSWWVGALRYPSRTIVTGALTARAWKTRVLTWLDAGEPRPAWRLVNGGTGDSVPVGAGVSSEELLLSVADGPVPALDLYGREVAIESPPLTPPFVPVGWNSWNTFFEDITPDDILEAARFVKQALPDLRINNVQVDDGWEVAWGDWTENERFPDGMDAVADSLAGEGFLPGIWWAPFLVDASSSVVVDHPHWLLYDERGEPVFYGSAALGFRYYALDASHPEVGAFVLETLARLLDDGYRYLKLDFLFGGAYEGVRFDPNVTGLMAYGAIVDEMSAMATARGAYLLACGAPLLPSAGRFHGVRTGDDIAFADLAYSFGMNKNAFRNVANRFYVNRFLASDPDTLLVRELPARTQRLNVTAALLSGRILNLGDDVASLDEERLSLLRRISELAVPDAFFEDPQSPAPRFLPLDLFEQPSPPADNKLALILSPDEYVVPSRWLLPLPDGRHLLAVFNWWSDDEARAVDVTDGVGAVSRARDLWSDEDVPLEGGKAQLDIERESVRLLLLE